MTTPQFIQIQPVLPAQDVTEAIHFYVEKLGFSLAFQDDVNAPRYAGVRRDGVELHLQWHDPATFEQVEKLNIRFVIKEIDALFAEYQNMGLFHSQTALRNTEWGTREFAFFDLNKNGLTFYRDL